MSPPRTERSAAVAPRSPAPAAEAPDLPDTLRTHALHAELTSGGHQLTVRLAGSRVPRSSPPFAWLGRGQAAPGPTAVVLGDGDRGRLCVDLAFAPDVLTLSGPVAACQAIAVAVTAQLCAAGVSVTVVGGALGPGVPTGCRRVETLADLDGLPGSAIDIVFCAGRHASDPTAVHRMLASSSHRLVPVILGSGPRARWSIQVGGSEG